MGFVDDSVIATDFVFMDRDATLYHFGILTSRMHNAWMRAVAGRLEMRYRYLKDLVYNNFICPSADFRYASQSLTCVSEIEKAAQAVLDARAKHRGQSLADLCDPLTMPPELVKAHAHLDALVDKAYGRTFANDAERVAHLFNLYAEAFHSDT